MKGAWQIYSVKVGRGGKKRISWISSVELFLIFMKDVLF